MWQGWELLGTIFVRWRRKPRLDLYSLFLFTSIFLSSLPYFDSTIGYFVPIISFRSFEFCSYGLLSGGLLKTTPRGYCILMRGDSLAIVIFNF